MLTVHKKTILEKGSTRAQRGALSRVEPFLGGRGEKKNSVPKRKGVLLFIQQLLKTAKCSALMRCILQGL
jgi:hypothetical protein